MGRSGKVALRKWDIRAETQRGNKPHEYLESVLEQADSTCQGPEAGMCQVCLEMKSERQTRGAGKTDTEGPPRSSSRP